MPNMCEKEAMILIEQLLMGDGTEVDGGEEIIEYLAKNGVKMICECVLKESNEKCEFC